MDDADVDLAVEGALFGGFGTAGQRCTSLGTAIVHESVFDEFVSKLSERLSSSPIGDPFARRAVRADDPRALRRALRGLARADPDHHTVYGSSARGRITASQPARGLRGRPRRGDLLPPDPGRGRDARTTRSTPPRRSARSSAWRRFSTFDEAMELANGHGYGLSSAIYTRSGENAFRFRERITAGMVSVNNSTSGAEAHLPFGGNGKSGNGSRQSGIWVLDQFTRWQSMNWDYAGKLQKAQMDNVELPADHGLPPLAPMLISEAPSPAAARRGDGRPGRAARPRARADGPGGCARPAGAPSPPRRCCSQSARRRATSL